MSFKLNHYIRYIQISKLIFIGFLIILLIGCKTNSNDIMEIKQPIIYNDLIVQEVISVYDGDTIRVNLINTNSLYDIISKNISIRLLDIDTPEIRNKSKRLKKLAIKARDHLETRLINSETIILKEVQRGMYFRILAILEVDGVNINQELIDLGLAKYYNGGSKKDLW